MFFPLLVTVYNNWINQKMITQRITGGIVKLLHKNKHGGDGFSKCHPLTTPNTDLKIFADRLQTAGQVK